jgi:hypothetical protein
LTSLTRAAALPEGTVRDQENIQRIDRFFSSTTKENPDHASTARRSEQVDLAFVSAWQEDAVSSLLAQAK